MSERNVNLFIELQAYMDCGRQRREGWYVTTCIEEGYSARKCCAACRALLRVRKALGLSGDVGVAP